VIGEIHACSCLLPSLHKRKVVAKNKTDVTPAILSPDFVEKLYRATKLQRVAVWCVAHCDFVA